MRTNGEVEIKLHAFRTSALRGHMWRTPLTINVKRRIDKDRRSLFYKTYKNDNRSEEYV
jgi:hypothetical protein